MLEICPLAQVLEIVKKYYCENTKVPGKPPDRPDPKLLLWENNKREESKYLGGENKQMA